MNVYMSESTSALVIIRILVKGELDQRLNSNSNASPYLNTHPNSKPNSKPHPDPSPNPIVNPKQSSKLAPILDFPERRDFPTINTFISHDIF